MPRGGRLHGEWPPRRQSPASRSWRRLRGGGSPGRLLRGEWAIRTAGDLRGRQGPLGPLARPQGPKPKGLRGLLAPEEKVVFRWKGTPWGRMAKAQRRRSALRKRRRSGKRPGRAVGLPRSRNGWPLSHPLWRKRPTNGRNEGRAEELREALRPRWARRRALLRRMARIKRSMAEGARRQP